MKKKEYIVPNIKVMPLGNEPVMNAGSKIGDEDDGGVTPIDDPYDGEFNSFGTNIWDDGE